MEFIWNMFLDFFNNNVLLVALIGWFSSQVIKTILNACVNKKISFERLIGDGGMPSGHSATVCSAAAMCGWTYGLNSAVFGIAFVLAIIVMHDASGVRREAGKQATTIKEMAETVNQVLEESEENIDADKINADKLKELIGHTPLQVVAGAVLGVVVTVIFCAIAGVGYMSGAPTPIV